MTQTNDDVKATWRKCKIAACLLLVALIAIFIAQNTQVVQVRFLFYSLIMSRALMLLITLLTGILLGFVGALFIRR